MKFRLLWLVLVTLAAGQGKAREWKDNQGRALQAEMLGVELNKAVVQLPGKQRALLPLSGLSTQDQEWVKTWAAGKTPAQLLPLPLWPETVQQPEIHVQQSAPSGNKFVFRSPHYEFECDDAVSVSVMNDFATVAEGTVRLLEALPIHWPRSDGKTFHARIFQNRNGYERAGGPPGSAGVFITADLSGEGVLLVPFESLGIEQFAGHNTKGYGYTATVLIHEMVHQATGGILILMPKWIGEGMAEYGANMTYRNGVFYFTERERLQALRQRLEYYDQISRDVIAKNPGAAQRLPSSWVMRPKELISKPESAWSTESKGRNAKIDLHRMYLSSMFLMYYFLHFADNGDARRIRVYFDQVAAASRFILTNGKEGILPEVLKKPGKLSREEIYSYFVGQLLQGQDLNALDADFHKRFTALGFRIGE